MIPRWVIAVSIGLNCFLIGVTLSQFIPNQAGAPHNRPDRPPGAFGPEKMGENIARRLTGADAEIVRATFAAHVQARTPEQRWARMERLRAILSANTFDPDSFRMELENLQADHQADDTAISAALGEAAGRLSTAGRLKLAEWLPPAPPGNGPRPPHGPGRDGPPQDDQSPDVDPD